MNIKRYSELEEFLLKPITPQFVCSLTDCICRFTQLTPPTTPKQKLPLFDAFVYNLLTMSRAQPGTILGAMVFLSRFHYYSNDLHLLFLVCLCLAGKVFNDTAPKSYHWAHYSKFYSAKDINQTELMLLKASNFNLNVSSQDLLEQVQVFSKFELETVTRSKSTYPLLSNYFQPSSFPINRNSFRSKTAHPYLPSNSTLYSRRVNRPLSIDKCQSLHSLEPSQIPSPLSLLLSSNSNLDGVDHPWLEAPLSAPVLVNSHQQVLKSNVPINY